VTPEGPASVSTKRERGGEGEGVVVGECFDKRAVPNVLHQGGTHGESAPKNPTVPVGNRGRGG